MEINWTTIIVGLAPALVGFLALRGQYKKELASASSQNVATAMQLKEWMEEEIEKLRARCAAMEIEISDQEAKIDCQENKIDVLRRRVRSLLDHAIKLHEQVVKNGEVPEVSIEEIRRAAQPEVRK